MKPEVFNNNEEIVYKTATAQGATDTFARIVIAQMKHESANFTSNVFLRNNNPMGMKMPSKRKSPYIARAGTQPPGNEGATPYARYNSLSDATKDLFHWLNYKGIKWASIKTVSDYAEQLRRASYMGNTQEAKQIYIAGLTRYLNGIAGKVAGQGSGLILLLAVGITIFLLIK